MTVVTCYVSWLTSTGYSSISLRTVDSTDGIATVPSYTESVDKDGGLQTPSQTYAIELSGNCSSHSCNDAKATDPRRHFNDTFATGRRSINQYSQQLKFQRIHSVRMVNVHDRTHRYNHGLDWLQEDLSVMAGITTEQYKNTKKLQKLSVTDNDSSRTFDDNRCARMTFDDKDCGAVAAREYRPAWNWNAPRLGSAKYYRKHLVTRSIVPYMPYNDIIDVGDLPALPALGPVPGGARRAVVYLLPIDTPETIPTAPPEQGEPSSSAEEQEPQPLKPTVPISLEDAATRIPHYTDASEVPSHLQKYFSQRARYFSRYDAGCLLDEEGWYSVTPEAIANQIAERCRCTTVLDAFCGVGGNAIAFARTCERVIALDTSPTRLALARHNARIYGVEDRIEFILADYLDFARSLLSTSTSTTAVSASLPAASQRKIDVIFLSPPWGGPSYLSMFTSNSDTPEADADAHPEYSLSSVRPVHGRTLFDLSRRITPNVAFYLPRNTNLTEVSDLLNILDDDDGGGGQIGGKRKRGGEEGRESVEVEEEWMVNKLKALTCYFGGLVEGQGHLF
ncbi:hypothetical protein EW146_g7424 [Bondarzewia mesenterica]|uniref:Trimethylguanosine synthase n=1 Tax=Bondarzewia mesenterica TaxID=1095465 RepID=A0A4S4LRG6_9AGAM|nr:hypothetical protein EW146_g7424 [Bondarzewia mesenterica]